MRVTFTARAAPPVQGGIQSYLRLVATGFAENGHAVTVLTQEASPKPGISNGRRLFDGAGFDAFERWGYTTAPLSATGPRRVIAGVAAALDVAAPHVPGVRAATRYPFVWALGPEIARRADAPDVVHAFNGGDFATASLRAARRLGVPFVITPHAHRGQWDDGPGDAATYREADAVVAVSEADADLYASLGVDRARLRLIRPCTAPPPPATADDERATLLFLGRRNEYKGVGLTLEAFARVRAVHPSARLVIAGPEPLPAGAVSDGVVDAGIVSEERKFALLRSVDLLCLPSAFESFGLVVAEAWSVGTAVLTSETPALAELVHAAGGGVAVPRDADAIAAAALDLLADPDRLRAYGAAGAEYWRAELSPERTVGELTDLYEELRGG